MRRDEVLTILAAHKRGVKVRIITDNDKAFDLGSDVPRFVQAGIPLLNEIGAFIPIFGIPAAIAWYFAYRYES